MSHEGGRCLDDIRRISEDRALRKLLGLKKVPTAFSIGNRPGRLGDRGVSSCYRLNPLLLSAALYRCKEVTLDIDAGAISACQGNFEI